MIIIGGVYRHKTDGGRYEVDAQPLSSGTMRRLGMEFVSYHSTEDMRKFVRDKYDFIEKMELIKT